MYPERLPRRTASGRPVSGERLGSVHGGSTLPQGAIAVSAESLPVLGVYRRLRPLVRSATGTVLDVI